MAGGFVGRSAELDRLADMLGTVGDPARDLPGVAFAGSIKWHETRGFGLREYNDLVRDVQHVPGVSDETTLLAVTRTGTADDEVPVRRFGPVDLLAAWPRGD
jgi:hypothetical protein